MIAMSSEGATMTVSRLLIAAALAVTQPALAQDARVETRAGALVGVEADGVRSFKGIPYAQPPVGPLRWAEPRPVRWQGDRPAREFGMACLQTGPADGTPNPGGHAGPSAEDCLYLNIWTPAGAKKAPVMLWLYGGGGVVGSGAVPAYDGTAFARDGVMLVTINYRHGSLAGFAHPALTAAATPEEGLGNYHLMDAMAALRWVRDNAAFFGGDPDNITLFGESAGATMTANLLTTPDARGLFAKAVIQSTGSLGAPGTPMAKAETLGAGIASAFGLSGKASVEQLRGIDADKLIADRKLGFGLRTIIDGRVKRESIMDAFEGGRAIDIPFIIGTNSDEGRLSGTQRVADLAMGGAPVWQYFFDYVPEWRRDEQPNGVPHAGEITYVFDTLKADRAGDRMTPRDQAVATRVHSCWVAFAKMAPGARDLTCADGFRWPARSAENGKVVAIFQEKPGLGRADDLRSPPNGAEPGPTSRDGD